MDRRRLLKALGLAATSLSPFLGRSRQTVALSGRAHASEPEAKAGAASPYFPQYQDFAARAGLNSPTIIGQVHQKKYILETMGGGIALFDYDSDGWLDIFLVNGSRLEGFPAGQEPISHLFKNNRDGTFTDVTAKAGLRHSGWGQGVCIGDYDNDGWEDLYVT